jgi:hypothetical protein
MSCPTGKDEGGKEKVQTYKPDFLLPAQIFKDDNGNGKVRQPNGQIAANV